MTRPPRSARLDRMCRRKRRFHDVEQAKDAAQAVRNCGGPELRAYACPVCDGAHLTRLGVEQPPAAEVQA